MSTNYDSTADTLAHIHKVRDRLGEFAAEMLARGRTHDASKLTPAEKPAFDVALSKLGQIPYGSPEYAALVAEMGPALAHHFAHNRHHPEHYGDLGVAGMDLFDVVEMVCDWIAASERVPGATVDLAHNVRQFDISPQLAAIIANTLARWPAKAG